MDKNKIDIVQRIKEELEKDGLIKQVSDCSVKVVLLGVIFQKLAYDIARKREYDDWRNTFFVKKYLPRYKVDVKKIAGTIGKYITQYGSSYTQFLYSKFHELPCDRKLTFDETDYLFYKGVYMSYKLTTSPEENNNNNG